MRFEVVWSSVAEDDLATLVGWLAERDASAAVRALDRIEARCRALERFPRRGRAIPELQGVSLPFELRQLSIPPWRVFFAVHARRVTVLGIVDGRADVEVWLRARSLAPPL